MPRWPLTRVLRPAEPPAPERSAHAARDRLLPSILCFTIGALALLQIPALPDLRWWLVLAVPALLPWRYRHFYALAVLGALLAGWRVQTLLDQRWPVERLGEDVWVTGSIASLPQGARSAGADGEERSENTRTWRFLFEPDAAQLPSRIRVSWYRSSETLRGGDCWRLQLRLRPPHGGSNPGGFDYEGWLFRQGIGATGTVRAAEACGTAPQHGLLRLRQRLAEQFGRWLPGHPALPLVAALTIGDTSALADEDWQNFRLTGTTHLIAISGFNVAIVAGVAFFLLRWLWSISAALCLRLPAQQAGLLGSALAALIYALLAGFDPPVERAALMLLLLVAAAWRDGLAQPARALAIAWAIIVAVDPLVLLTPGLWLSFGAVAAIYFVTAGRLENHSALREALRVQLMLSLVLAPLTLFWFQGTSLLGPLVNLVAVPAAAVLTPALLGALILAAVVPMIGIPVLQSVATGLTWSSQGLGWLATQMPQAWLAASPQPAAVALALLGALLLFLPRGLPLRALGLLCFGALALPPGQAPKSGFELVALDVGQGLAVVVRTAQHALLFDTGPAYPEGFDAGRSVIVPYLLRAGIRRLDLLIVSHGDLDHRGGAPAVRELLPVTRELGALADEACDRQTWNWDGVRFEILNGPTPGLSDNDGGCVLKIDGENLSALLPADIEASGEQNLLRDHADRLRADVLFAPHHGSRTSSSAAFIETVQPKIVIFSAGWHHRFGHPSPEVVTRYRDLDSGVRQYASGDSGAVIVRSGPEGPKVSEWRNEDQRLWSTPSDYAWTRAESPKASSDSARRRKPASGRKTSRSPRTSAPE